MFDYSINLEIIMHAEKKYVTNFMGKTECQLLML